MNPLKQLQQYGQSIYLDEIRRSWITDGQLQRLIDEDGVRGVTSNPAIFQKAIADSNDYDAAVQEHARNGDDAPSTLEALMVSDIRDAADLFRPMFDASQGAHGFVSLEVSPEHAHDEEATVQEGLHLFKEVSRPNAFIKVPATDAGLGAIRRLTSAGVNVNITLLFGLPRYEQVIDAYLSGLEERVQRGEPISGIASVASFFLSRLDVMIDPLLDRVADNGGPQSSAAHQLRGTVAINSAKVAYQIYQREFLSSPRFAALAKEGAQKQRLLWASTSTKDPTYPDVKYVEALVGEDTINTLPLETMGAYRDHGSPRAGAILEDADNARGMLDALTGVAVDLGAVVETLEEEGVEKFISAQRSLLQTLEKALAGTHA